MIEKKIGKITDVRFGYGGYDDAMMGLSLSFGSAGWGVSTFKGTWATHSDGAEWTLADQQKTFGDTVLLIRDTLAKAKKTEVHELEGVPVECTFDGLVLKSWRILEEVI